MAKARTIKIKGIAKWAKVFEENRDMEGYNGVYQDCDGACTIDLLVEPDQLAILKEAGSMIRGTMTDDGMKVKFKRKFIGPFKEASGAPKVTTNEGKPWKIDEMGTIGNDSEVEVTATVYDIKAYGTSGTRLDAVRVINHVVYERPEEQVEGDEVTV